MELPVKLLLSHQLAEPGQPASSIHCQDYSEEAKLEDVFQLHILPMLWNFVWSYDDSFQAF